MENILAIICIGFITLFTYAAIQGYNITKFHKYNCHTVYIPDNINLEQAFQSVNNLSLNKLKKKDRQLGASKDFIDKYNNEDSKKYIKSYIIQNSISEDHILFNDITEDIDLRENIKKREYCRQLDREGLDMNTCPQLPAKLEDYSKIVIPLPTNQLEKDHYFIEYEFIKPEDIVDSMKKDQKDYEDKNIEFMLQDYE